MNFFGPPRPERARPERVLLRRNTLYIKLIADARLNWKRILLLLCRAV